MFAIHGSGGGGGGGGDGSGGGVGGGHGGGEGSFLPLVSLPVLLGWLSVVLVIHFAITVIVCFLPPLLVQHIFVIILFTTGIILLVQMLSFLCTCMHRITACN